MMCDAGLWFTSIPCPAGLLQSPYLRWCSEFAFLLVPQQQSAVYIISRYRAILQSSWQILLWCLLIDASEALLAGEYPRTAREVATLLFANS